MCFPIPVHVLLLPGQALIGARSLSYIGLLQTAPIGYVALTYGVVFSSVDREITLGLTFTHGFIFSEFSEKPANLPHLKTCWARSLFHWYDYLAAMFIPSLGTTDVMLRVDVLTNFTQQTL